MELITNCKGGIDRMNNILTNLHNDYKQIVAQEYQYRYITEKVTYYRSRQPGPEALIEDALLEEIPNILSSNAHPFWIAAYLTIGAGLPDYTVAAFKSEIFKIADVDQVSTDLLAYLRSVSHARADTIANRLCQSLDETMTTLIELVTAGVVVENGKTFRLSKTWHSILPDVFTIEAKVVNWQNAIEQAIRNQLFSHRSFIALPTKTAQKASFNSNKVKEFGIGVIGVSEDGSVSILRQARRTNPKVWTYYFKVALQVVKKSRM